MAWKQKLIFFLSVCIVLAFVFIPSGSNTKDANAIEAWKITRLIGPFRPTGGKIIEKSWQFCIVPVPFPPYFIPYPFIYLEIDKPTPSKTYFLRIIPGVSIPIDPSILYREYELEETAWGLGNYMLEADDAFRILCRNGNFLPEADGVVRHMGTSCKEGEGTRCRNDGGSGDSLKAPTFNPKDFLDFCDPLSKPGECLPITTPPVEGGGGGGGGDDPPGGIPNIPPAPPTTVTAFHRNSQLGSEVIISWNPAIDDSGEIAYYGVHRDGVTIGSFITNLTYTDRNSPPGSHTYCITATDTTGMSSSVNCTTVTVSPVGGGGGGGGGDTTPPSTPSGSSGVYVAGVGVRISHGTSTDNVGVTDYYISTNNGANYFGGVLSTWTDTRSLSAGTYTYLIVARDAVGNQSPPASVNVIVP
ncbi:MAG: hypothetical protein COT91_02460 [Candidatus Doudnabacteria bacterium CG10_big_fil_rev_8_21_14_0_10_41_10]|uniref:Fibronectin type-III domain-containing protein n=1 Tax=Candidatus Doudnabacteria bacterium CG10_big_fil_rev_8_21_14_0_10_41_10 TaxID=1974551 RepID=A0A2H0VDV0_9BACT|nr:MAG: hypothetical protein COT91_02460 [Candidatus Doudnabacteria bacterium CG10_big_fil_rev_8_21_14_0_10_41_10]